MVGLRTSGVVNFRRVQRDDAGRRIGMALARLPRTRFWSV